MQISRSIICFCLNKCFHLHRFSLKNEELSSRWTSRFRSTFISFNSNWFCESVIDLCSPIKSSLTCLEEGKYLSQHKFLPMSMQKGNEHFSTLHWIICKIFSLAFTKSTRFEEDFLIFTFLFEQWNYFQVHFINDLFFLIRIQFHFNCWRKIVVRRENQQKRFDDEKNLFICLTNWRRNCPCAGLVRFHLTKVKWRKCLKSFRERRVASFSLQPISSFPTTTKFLLHLNENCSLCLQFEHWFSFSIPMEIRSTDFTHQNHFSSWRKIFNRIRWRWETKTEDQQWNLFGENLQSIVQNELFQPTNCWQKRKSSFANCHFSYRNPIFNNSFLDKEWWWNRLSN